MLCTSSLSNGYVVNACQKTLDPITLFKNKKHFLTLWLWTLTYCICRKWVGMKALVCKEGGNFRKHWHPKAPEKHETSLWVIGIPAPFSEGRHFRAGWLPLGLPYCLAGRVLIHGTPYLSHTGSHGEAVQLRQSCHPVILAVGLGNKKAVKWGVVRTEWYKTGKALGTATVPQ